jgi:predicted short-subunit dehydrogenase-like oxidoreductase (DUF2520 family)
MLMESPEKIALIGAGALGKALKTHFFSGFSVDCFGRNEQNWGLGITKNLDEHLISLSEYTIIFICVTDSEIPKVCEKIKPYITSKQWVIHGSGSIPESVLHGISDTTGVIHFLQTFYAQSYELSNPFLGISATFVGNSTVENWLRKVSESHAINVKKVTEAQKKQVHIAAVFACNFQHVLLDAAGRISGFSPEETLQFLNPLVEQTLRTVVKSGAVTTLSGPVKRRDYSVLEHHKQWLSEHHPDLTPIYEAFSQYLLKRLDEIGG